ncbi:hypothetical protein [Pseudooctadecabacter jejudonensis]|uniref:Uncharacterized protein n=1 Tax=Pseudooctadecabacter jejudonensis TaxID=1391910 RepID=A0A1Y5T4W9_9RHOB|nr:hypothetical protein [Pseudooctadecabacter jejudonensis]SLN55865.1 hypothetical protein PSJ8397_02949 [Pseudooctadecabacter jejudonensis]
MRVLVLGSGPTVTQAAAWDRGPFDVIVAINNAWRVRPDWDFLIHPSDFPADRQPVDLAASQKIITYETYVPAQNALGGFVYAGGTMAFTAGYWALHDLQPSVMAFLGCDMTYDGAQTHFYGQGTADPLRADVTLRSLEGKSARLQAMAAARGCRTLNLSQEASRLVFPRAAPDDLSAIPKIDQAAVDHALALEARAGYMVPSGKYWKEEDRFDPAVIDAIDAAWLNTCRA